MKTNKVREYKKRLSFVNTKNLDDIEKLYNYDAEVFTDSPDFVWSLDSPQHDFFQRHQSRQRIKRSFSFEIDCRQTNHFEHFHLRNRDCGHKINFGAVNAQFFERFFQDHLLFGYRR